MAYPDESNLTQLATLKAYLDPPPNGTTSDTTLSALITRASNTITQLLDRPNLISRSITETRDGYGGQVLQLKVYPATAVSSVTIGTTVVPLSVNQTNGWVFDKDASQVKLLGSYYFTPGFQNITLIYTAGYSITGQEVFMLEQACLAMCALWWKRRAHIDQASMAMSAGGGTLSFTMKDIPTEARMIIDQLKTIYPVFG